MRKSKGFSVIEVIIVLAVAGILIAVGMVVFSRKEGNSTPKNNGTSKTSTSADLPSCEYKGYKAKAPRKDAINAVTSGPTDVKNIKYLLNHASGDERFVYMVNNTEDEIPVYAPADGQLVYVINKHADNWDIAGGRPADYDMTFTVDCKSFWRINHVVNPIDEIKNAEPNDQVVELKAGQGLKDEWGRPKSSVYVKAGQKIGTTKVPSYTQWDIGYFKDGQATCIFNELTSSKDSWLNLMSPVMGMNAKPTPGTACTGQSGGI